MPKRILWIDDELSHLHYYHEMLHRRGYQFDLCSNNDSALQCLRDKPDYTLIIQDVMRPLGKCLTINEKAQPGFHESGLVFYEKYIKRICPQTPVLFATASGLVRTHDQIRRFGNCEILTKPFSFETIFSVIERIASPSVEHMYDYIDPGEDVSSIIQTDFSIVNHKLLSYLARHPTLLYSLTPRRFEELVEQILRDLGYETTLTPPSRDGGADIYAIQKTSVGELLYVVECKKYSPERPVGVGQVRALHGVKNIAGASAAILVTTSSFTAPARALQNSLRYEMSLRDYDNVTEWLQRYGLSK